MIIFNFNIIDFSFINICLNPVYKRNLLIITKLQITNIDFSSLMFLHTSVTTNIRSDQCFDFLIRNLIYKF